MDSKWFLVVSFGVSVLLALNFCSQGGLNLYIGGDRQVELNAHCERYLNSAHEHCENLIGEYRRIIEDKDHSCANSLERARADDWISESNWNRTIRVQTWNLEKLYKNVHVSGSSCQELQGELEKCANELNNCSHAWDAFRVKLDVNCQLKGQFQVAQRDRGLKRLRIHAEKLYSQLQSCLVQLQMGERNWFDVTSVMCFLVVIGTTFAVVKVSGLQLQESGNESHQVTPQPPRDKYTQTEADVSHDLTTQIAGKDSQNEALLTAVTRLRAALVSKDEEVATMKALLAGMATEKELQFQHELVHMKEVLQEKEQSYQSSLEYKDGECTRMKEELLARESELKDLQSTHEQLRRCLLGRNVQIQHLERKLEQSQDELKNTGSVVRDKDKQSCDMQQKVTGMQLTFQQQIEAVQGQAVVHLQADHSSKTQQLVAELREQLHEKDLQLQMKDQRIHELVEQGKERDGLLESQEVKAQYMMSRREERIFQLEEELSGANQNINRLETEIEQRQLLCPETQKHGKWSWKDLQISKAKQQIASLEKKNRELQKCNEELRKVYHSRLQRQANQRVDAIEVENVLLKMKLEESLFTIQQRDDDFILMEAERLKYEKRCKEFQKQGAIYQALRKDHGIIKKRYEEYLKFKPTVTTSPRQASSESRLQEEFQLSQSNGRQSFVNVTISLSMPSGLN